MTTVSKPLYEIETFDEVDVRIHHITCSNLSEVLASLMCTHIPLVNSWKVSISTVVCEGCYEAVESFVHRRIRLFTDNDIGFAS